MNIDYLLKLHCVTRKKKPNSEIPVLPSVKGVFGVKIDTSDPNPESAVTYTDDALGFAPAKMNFATDTFDYGNWANVYPFNQIKPCMLKNGVVTYYLNPNDYSKKLDGTSADITTGNDGDVMIEFPKIYWKFDDVGSSLYVRYSDTQVDEGYRALAHTRGGEEKDVIYISAYMGITLSSKLRSLSGKTATSSRTIGTFRTQAQANGSGYEQMPYFPLLMLQVLYLVMFKNRDAQSALGRGYVDGNTSAISTGKTNTKGLFYGETSGKNQMKFCGIEDWYGNYLYWVDGIISNASRNILINSDNTNFSDTGANYTVYSSGITSNGSGFIDAVQGGTETGFTPRSFDGSETAYYSDFVAFSASRVPRFGGDLDNKFNAGAFALNFRNDASNTATNTSSRIFYS